MTFPFPQDVFLLAQKIVETCLISGKTLALAESCTGGLVASAITSIPGSSSVLERGFVVYTNIAKQENLDVSPEILRTFTAVSEETARAMAQGTLAHSHADFTFSVTGIAGPGGATEGRPVGLVHLCVAGRDGRCVHERHVFPGNREDVRMAALLRGLKMIQDFMS
ncbi:MAG TPA: damage-inducible protein CinA [Rhodospirillaceae bacterium]|nr:MAG: hypothetical protein A2018_04175 [Alphaproteobacteria bacterium GWF2_58_20]HAU28718.1 damage-inducible protein CinA [Rhodospirillaceae bacterium]